MTIRKELAEKRKVKPDFNGALPFGKYFTDHMFLMDFEGGEWRNARIVPYAPFEMEPSAMVFHYGQALFEGLKAYRAADGRVLLFRPELNMARFNLSGERMCVPLIDEGFVLEALRELIDTEREWIPDAPNASLYIRPFVIATEAALGVHPANRFLFAIILSPVGPYYDGGLAPVKIAVEDEYVRSVRGGVGFTKAAANYAVSLKGQEKAKAAGYEQVLWLDGVERRYIEEVGAMNVFFKIGGAVVTPELSGSILGGITRRSVIELLNSWGVPCEERRVSVGELTEALRDGRLEEAFGSGTAAVISPIGEFYVGGKKTVVGGGGIGELSRRIYDTLTGIQYGRVADTFGWTVAV